MKVPPFWPDEPTLWFAQLEGQFALANITADSTKYNYVVSNLEYKYVTEVKDVIKQPPESGKYEKIKKELIGRLSASQEQRVRQLLTSEDIGDRKPSQFLRHLQGLAGPGVPDDFIKSLWASRLPTNIQMIIATQTGGSIDTLATLADTVSEVISQPHVHQVSQAPGPAATEVNDLKRCVEDLTRQVAALSASQRQRSRSRGRADWRWRSRSSSSSRQSTCWYHRKFKGDATKCRPPCNFEEKNE